MNMNLLAEASVRHIEGLIPDLCEGLTTDREKRDAVYDCACDYIYDTMPDNAPISRNETDLIHEAAKQIAEHYFGEEEGDV